MPHVKGNKFKPKIDDATNEDKTPKNDAANANDKTETTNKSKKRKIPEQIQTIVLPPPSKKGSSSTPVVAATSNWALLQASQQTKKRKKHQENNNEKATAATTKTTITTQTTQAVLPNLQSITRHVALDCEMVGIGRDGEISALARVSIVDSGGKVLYDSYVKPTSKITDYRTEFSGIRPRHLKDAPPLHQVQRHVTQILRGRILVGHALHNDLMALGIDHPQHDVRDTAKYPPFRTRSLLSERMRPRALRELVHEHLGMVIQEGEHNSIEDARAALRLYHKHKGAWEKWHQSSMKKKKKGKKGQVKKGFLDGYDSD